MRHRSLLALTLGVAFVALSIAPLLVLLPMGHHTEALSLSLLGTAVAVVLFSALSRPVVDLFEPLWLFSAVYVVGFWLKPMLVVARPEVFKISYLDYSQGAMRSACVLGAFGFLAFVAGYRLATWRRSVDPFTRLRWPWRRGRVVLAATVSVGLFVWLLYYFLAKSGFDIVYMYQNRAAVNRLDGDLVFLLHFVAWMAVILPFSLYCMRPRWQWGLVTFVSILAVMAGMSVFAARFSLLMTIVGLLVVRHYAIRRISYPRLLVVGVAVLLAHSAFGTVRGWVTHEPTRPRRSLSNTLSGEIKSVADWDIFAAIIDYYPESHEHYFGQLAVESTYWLIPRRVWSGKPVWYGPQRIQDDIAPGLLSASNQGGFVGTSIAQSTLGEGYAEFGAFGVVAYLLMFGFVWGRLYRFVRVHRGSFPVASIYAPIYAYLPMALRSFTSLLLMMALWFTTMFILCSLMERRRAYSGRLSSRGPSVQAVAARVASP